MGKLNVELKEQLIKYLFEIEMENMNHMDIQKDTILHGREYVGLLNMTDEDLVMKYEMSVDEDDSLLIECKLELSIDKTLRVE